MNKNEVVEWIGRQAQMSSKTFKKAKEDFLLDVSCISQNISWCSKLIEQEQTAATWMWVSMQKAWIDEDLQKGLGHVRNRLVEQLCQLARDGSSSSHFSNAVNYHKAQALTWVIADIQSVLERMSEEGR